MAAASDGACEVCQARRESSPGGASVLFMTDDAIACRVALAECFRMASNSIFFASDATARVINNRPQPSPPDPDVSRPSPTNMAVPSFSNGHSERCVQLSLSYPLMPCLFADLLAEMRV
jgi:hypothetical protein